ncbi:MAG: RNA polymerase sigma factor [Bacteroidota bacterium]
MRTRETNTDLLVEACLLGKRLAQRQLYEKHLPYALTVTRRFGVASRDQADVMQEVFAEVFSKLHPYDADKGKFTTWFRTITVRKTIDFLRQREKLKFTELVAVIPEKTTAESLDFLDQLPTDELFNALQSLPVGFRTVFNLYAVDGYRHQEIGKMLGISASASRSQYTRARERLRKHLTSTTQKKMTHEY